MSDTPIVSPRSRSSRNNRFTKPPRNRREKRAAATHLRKWLLSRTPYFPPLKQTNKSKSPARRARRPQRVKQGKQRVFALIRAFSFSAALHSWETRTKQSPRLIEVSNQKRRDEDAPRTTHATLVRTQIECAGLTSAVAAIAGEQRNRRNYTCTRSRATNE